MRKTSFICLFDFVNFNIAKLIKLRQAFVKMVSNKYIKRQIYKNSSLYLKIFHLSHDTTSDMLAFLFISVQQVSKAAIFTSTNRCFITTNVNVSKIKILDAKTVAM